MDKALVRFIHRVFFSELPILRPSISGLVYLSIVLGTMIGAPLAYALGATSQEGVFVLLGGAISLVIPLVFAHLVLYEFFRSP